MKKLSILILEEERESRLKNPYQNLLRKEENYSSEIYKGHRKHKTRNMCEFRYSLFRDTG